MKITNLDILSRKAFKLNQYVCVRARARVCMCVSVTPQYPPSPIYGVNKLNLMVM